ncbi:hypothetical protein RHMOL_Rhmol11G0285600 [Rhododendron molle]|uniref:Uncharacterized protein n=1 Tax=Rhododendron molle TaxID=49168 RepID=A0ACC0LY36_RHOML|nr:hypothetical protein RHMOL_Rhmol11G0285600 [Rhododendron molle]
MAPLSPTPTSSPPPESSTVDPFPPVSPISTASSPPSSPRTATDLSQPGSPKRMDDGGLEEQEIDWSKDYPLGFGMKFDIETAAYDFYNDHGRVMGFSIRKSYFTRSKKDGILINRKFVCSKQGKRGIDKRSLVVEQPRKQTRTNCGAFMYISFSREKSKWSVKNFEEKHNHILHIPETVYKMRSQRKIHEAQALNIAIAVDSGLSLKASHDLISAQVEGKGNVGFTQEDHKDQDAAMAKAISIAMPDVTHGLCTFHLQQNALKHLGHLYKEDSDFGKDFSACIFEYIEEEELIQGWDALVKKYDLNENMWIKKTWGLREKWAHAYLKLSFIAGMRSTQLSESLNAKVKKYVKFDHDIVQFFTHFDRLVMEKREEESDSIYHSREKLQRQKLKKSPILIQVAKLYTPPIFDLFHDEVDTSLACKVKQHHELEGSFKCVVRLHKRAKKRFLVSGLDRMGILEIPESYILARLRLDAKDCASKGSNVSVEEKDPKLIKAARYRNLCPKMVKLGARACHLKVAYDFVNTTVNYMCDTVDKMFLEEGDSIEVGIKVVDVIHSNLVQAKGLKRKTAPRKGGARLKPWHEKIGKRRRVASKPTHLSRDVPIPYIPDMINCGSNSQSAPSSSEIVPCAQYSDSQIHINLCSLALSNPKPLNLCSSSVNCFSSQNFTNLLLIVSKKFISIGDAGWDESVAVLGYESGEMRDAGGNRLTVMPVVVRKWLLATGEAIDGGNRSTVMPVVVRKWLLATGEAIDGGNRSTVMPVLVRKWLLAIGEAIDKHEELGLVPFTAIFRNYYPLLCRACVRV